jgi:hypothetical protein
LLSQLRNPDWKVAPVLPTHSMLRPGEADVLLMLGTDFPYRQFYPEKGCSTNGHDTPD